MSGNQNAKGILNDEKKGLVERHVWLAHRIAREYARRLQKRTYELQGAEELKEDVKSAAYLGLVKAARDWEKARGIPFALYAEPRIRGAVADMLRKERPLGFREPGQERTKYEAKKGVPISEIAERRRQTPKKVQEIISRRKTVLVSLETPVYGDEDSARLKETIAAEPLDDPEKAQKLVVRAAQNALNEREFEIFVRRLSGEEVKTIALEKGVTESRISQIFTRASTKMREYFNRYRVNCYEDLLEE